MRALGIAASLSALLALATGVAGTEDPVPRTRAEIVRLDVVVTDSQGTPVRDLTRDDFHVLEDGKPQRLTHFTVADRRGPTPGAEGEAEAEPAPSGTPDRAAPAAGEGRQIVVFVDDLHMQVESVVLAKEALLRFADEFLVADDNVALLTASGGAGSHRLTQDRATLRQAINRLVLRDAPSLPGQATQMTPAQAEMILRGDSGALKLAARTLMDTPGSGYNPGDAALIGSSRLIMGTGDPEERGAAAEAERQARAILADALRFSTATLQRLDDVVRGLSSLPGRKLCLLVSDGFLVGAGTSEELTHDMQGVVDAATRAGAVVYVLDSRGLVTRGVDAGVGGPSARPDARFGVDRRAEQLFRDTLETLSNDTGGFLVRATNDLAGGLRRMLGDNESYYLMAYEPTNTKRDGKFRKIEVRLSRGVGYLVRTRKGYLAPDDRKEARRSPASVRPLGLDDAEVRAVLSAPRPSGDIPVHLSADYLDLPPSGPQAVVRAHVDLAALRWQEAAGRRQAALDVWGRIFDASGNAVGEPFGRHSDLDLTAEQHKRATREGFQYQQQVALPPGRYEIRFVAAESHAGRLGGASQWLDIPDLAEKKLAMSSVFLSSSAGTGGQDAGTGGGEALRAVPALRRFRRDDSLYFQVYVYNPAVDEKGASDVVLQAQIWSEGKVIAASKLRHAALERKDGMPAPETNGMSLQELTPGDYSLKVVVVDRQANATTARSIDLTVE